MEGTSLSARVSLYFYVSRRSNLFTPSGKGKGEEKRAGEVGSGRNIPVRQGYLYKKSNKSFSKVSYLFIFLF